VFIANLIAKCAKMYCKTNAQMLRLNFLKHFIGTIPQKLTKVLDKQAFLTFLPSTRIFFKVVYNSIDQLCLLQEFKFFGFE
jgi:hypothetical protein